MQVTFLGCTFRPRRAQNRAGERFTSFLPGASGPAQQRRRQQSAQGHLPRQTTESLRALATHDNASLAGWWQYSGSFSPTAVCNVLRHCDLTLAWWARRKYKPLRGHKHRSRRWLAQVSRQESALFVHWRLW
jgi:4-alpha-glucanotransferase